MLLADLLERNSIKSSINLNNEPPVSRQAAADHLGISKPTLDNLIKTGQLPAFNIGRQVRIKWSDIEAYVNKKGAAI
jgi:excisionase family DNA binding protein